jgi:ribosomal protein L29
MAKTESFLALKILSEEALRGEVIQGKRALFNFRFQKKINAAKPHEVRAMRKRVARLKTAMVQKKFEGQGGE